MSTEAKELVERLKPAWATDEEITRAAARRDANMRAIVTDFLVANNVLKQEAAALIEKQAVQIVALMDALQPFAGGSPDVSGRAVILNDPDISASTAHRNARQTLEAHS